MKIVKGLVKDINHFAKAFLFDKIRADYPNHDNWWKKVTDRDCWYLIIKDEIVAACIVKVENGNECDFPTFEKKILKISLLIVLDKYKNQGIASSFLDKVETYSIENGINDIYVSTKSSNESAINFFIKNNFQIVQILKNEIYLHKVGLSNYIEINRKAYNSLSHEYKIRGEVKSGYEETPSFLVDNILDVLPQNKVYNVLEIGPGSGEIVEEFEKKGNRTIAVELSIEISKIVKDKSPQTIVINSNILEVNFLFNQFDIIYAGALIHLFDENDASILLKKISKWLKKDGVLFINTTKSKVTEEGFYYKEDYKVKVKRFRRKWKENDFENLVKEKFSIEKTLYTNELDRKKIWVGYICRKN